MADINYTDEGWSPFGGFKWERRSLPCSTYAKGEGNTESGALRDVTKSDKDAIKELKAAFMGTGPKGQVARGSIRAWISSALPTPLQQISSSNAPSATKFAMAWYAGATSIEITCPGPFTRRAYDLSETDSSPLEGI